MPPARARGGPPQRRARSRRTSPCRRARATASSRSRVSSRRTSSRRSTVRCRWRRRCRSRSASGATTGRASIRGPGFPQCGRAPSPRSRASGSKQRGTWRARSRPPLHRLRGSRRRSRSCPVGPRQPPHLPCEQCVPVRSAQPRGCGRRRAENCGTLARLRRPAASTVTTCTVVSAAAAHPELEPALPQRLVGQRPGAHPHYHALRSRSCDPGDDAERQLIGRGLLDRGRRWGSGDHGGTVAFPACRSSLISISTPSSLPSRSSRTPRSGRVRSSSAATRRVVESSPRRTTSPAGSASTRR